MFVSVDGPSGAGKSTIVQHLAQLLVAAGEDVHVTAEPSEGPTGALCRELTEEGMQALGFIALFPLMFVSSMFVPVASLPGWLQVIANLNPVTYAIDAARNLTLGMPVGNGVVASLIASACLVAVGMVGAVIGFRRPL